MRVSVENIPAGIAFNSITDAVNAARFFIAANDRPLRVRFVTPAQIADLHSKFKDQSGPTNVLTFVSPSGADIAICPCIAAEDATIRGWDLASELIYLAVHGALHAFGFDHDNPIEAAKMRDIEHLVLTSLGIDPLPLGPA